MKILILGAGGMFGSMIDRVLSETGRYEMHRTLRPDTPTIPGLPPSQTSHLDVLDDTGMLALLVAEAPDVVINCTGLIKHRPEAADPLAIMPINALFPHRLAGFCKLVGARLVQFSTDCVFSGQKGMYGDDDPVDVSDLYGLSKYVGEVRDQDHVLTLRTSIIGHERASSYQLIEWFLSQNQQVTGFTRAIFSGFPTVEIGHILDAHVLGNPALSGLYNLAAAPISKHDLLTIVREVYGHAIEIVPDDAVRIDRSLDGSRFQAATGYAPPPWQELIAAMHTTR